MGLDDRSTAEQKVADALVEAVARFGRGRCEDPSTLRSLLNDLLGADALVARREAKLVVDAAAAHLPGALDGGVSAPRLDQLATWLASETGATEGSAHFAVEAWSRAVGTVTSGPEAVPPAPTPSVVPPAPSTPVEEVWATTPGRPAADQARRRRPLLVAAAAGAITTVVAAVVVGTGVLTDSGGGGLGSAGLNDDQEYVLRAAQRPAEDCEPVDDLSREELAAVLADDSLPADDFTDATATLRCMAAAEEGDQPDDTITEFHGRAGDGFDLDQTMSDIGFAQSTSPNYWSGGRYLVFDGPGEAATVIWSTDVNRDLVSYATSEENSSDELADWFTKTH